MKKRILNFVLIAGFAAGSVACKSDKQNEAKTEEAREVAATSEEAVTYEIDKTASTITWRGTKPTGEHKGTIDIQNGQIVISGNKITGGKVMIDMNSIAVTDEDMDEENRSKLENHLKGTVEGKETDFFNVKKYPVASFEITGLSGNNEEQLLEGNLTLKDETKHIEFPVKAIVEDDMVSIESQTFTIDRTNWGVNYGSKTVFDNLGDQFISDDMELTIKVKANRL